MLFPHMGHHTDLAAGYALKPHSTDYGRGSNLVPPPRGSLRLVEGLFDRQNFARTYKGRFSDENAGSDKRSITGSEGSNVDGLQTDKVHSGDGSSLHRVIVGSHPYHSCSM